MKNNIVIGYSTNRSKAFQKEFNLELLDSVGLPDDKVAIIPYDNQGLLSLTEAYNDLWQCASIFKEAVFVFIHHDIHFKSKNWGKTVLDLFNNNPVDILGVVGSEILYDHCGWWFNEDAEFNMKELWGKVWHMDKKQGEIIADYTTPNKTCRTLQPVVTVDGLFMAFDPDTCSEFDEDFGDFHFYDVSFCVKNFLQGKHIAVTESIQICHESPGGTNAAWDQNRLTFYNKYLHTYHCRFTKVLSSDL